MHTKNSHGLIECHALVVVIGALNNEELIAINSTTRNRVILVGSQILISFFCTSRDSKAAPIGNTIVGTLSSCDSNATLGIGKLTLTIANPEVLAVQCLILEIDIVIIEFGIIIVG